MDAAPRDRRGDQDRAHLVLEVRNRLVAVLLVHAAVKREGVVPAAQQVTEQLRVKHALNRHVIRLLLLVHEDQDQSTVVPLAENLQ